MTTREALERVVELAEAFRAAVGATYLTSDLRDEEAIALVAELTVELAEEAQ